MSANVRHSSATNEHYTPPAIVEAARATMGGIDLDPASNAIANTIVQAPTCFSSESGATLTRYWNLPHPTRVFLNPPGGKCDPEGVTVISSAIRGRGWTCDLSGESCEHVHTGVASSQKAWWKKLVEEWEAGRVLEAIFVGFSLEILQTSQVGMRDHEKIPLDFPMCIPSRRVAYFRENEEGRLVVGSSPPHASVLIYLPQKTWPSTNLGRFVREFSKFGRVILPSLLPKE